MSATLDELIRAGKEIVPGYRLVQLIGRGGYGEVWTAATPGDGRCALKIIRNVNAAEGKGQFRSLAIIRDLDHDRLIRLQAYWLLAENGSVVPDDVVDQMGAPTSCALAIAMELAHQNLQQRRLECQDQGEPGIPSDELVGYIRQSAEAIDYLNFQEPAIVHRNISPQNILLTKNRRVKVSGFGFVQLVAGTFAAINSTSVRLTLAYSAPELFRNTVTRRTDQYSLALTYYELRAGRLPFDEGFGPMQMMQAHVEGKLDFTGVNQAEQSVLKRACAVEPDGRFRSCVEFVTELERALSASHPSVASISIPATPTDTVKPSVAARMGPPTVAYSPPPSADSDSSIELREDPPDLLDPPHAQERHAPRAPLQDTDLNIDLGGDVRPPESTPAPKRAPAQYLDEDVQFTVFRPTVVSPQKWYPLLAFAHNAERRPEADPDEPDPVEEVRRQAERVLGKQAKDYKDRTQDALQAVPREGELTFLPEMDGVEFNPPRRTFRWSESVHREEFRLRAGRELDGKMARGRLSVFLGGILLADVALAFRVDGRLVAEKEPLTPTETRPYRKIFASYSHQDLEIVRQLEHYAETLGDRYLRDWTHLRAGEVWNERLMELIQEADVFQLFWSTNAMRSQFVRREWQHALSLGRPSFVRPTYWEDPMPTSPEEDLPPEALLRLHFQRLATADLQQGKEATSKTVPTRVTSSSPRPPADSCSVGQPDTCFPKSSTFHEARSPVKALVGLAVVLLLAVSLITTLGKSKWGFGTVTAPPPTTQHKQSPP
jgi:serine/threonine protein kinase